MAADGNYELSLLFHDGTILTKNKDDAYPEKKVDSYAAVTS